MLSSGLWSLRARRLSKQPQLLQSPQPLNSAMDENHAFNGWGTLMQSIMKT